MGNKEWLYHIYSHSQGNQQGFCWQYDEGKDGVPKSEPIKIEETENWDKVFKIQNPDGIAVGEIQTWVVDDTSRLFDYAIQVFGEFKGKGIGTEALVVILDYYFNELNMRICRSAVYSYNRPSQKFHEKFGFTKEGVGRKQVYARGKYYDMIYYSIFNEEFNKKYSHFQIDAEFEVMANETAKAVSEATLKTDATAKTMPIDISPKTTFADVMVEIIKEQPKDKSITALYDFMFSGNGTYRALTSYRLFAKMLDQCGAKTPFQICPVGYDGVVLFTLKSQNSNLIFSFDPQEVWWEIKDNLGIILENGLIDAQDFYSDLKKVVNMFYKEVK